MKLFSLKNNHWCLFILSVSLLLSCTDFATDDRKNVSFILKKDGKSYLFSRLGTFITKNSLDKNESPPVVTSARIVEKDGKLYMEPQYIKNIANLISGNYVLHDYQEKSFDGYVTEGEHDVYDKKYANESTAEIGKMASIAHIYLKDIEERREYHISWQRSPDQSPIKNCVELSLWVDKSYKPGERTAAKEKFIMIGLDNLVEFFPSKVKLDYVKDEEVLYLIVD
jgi:hypothetical protein